MQKRVLSLQIFIFILWIVVALITGINHEPWADEAQAWLIVRDNSFPDIIKILKYEGHPVLWYFILKIVTFINFPYDLFFIIPVILSGFGIFCLLFKTKLPLVVKILFPFTFFVLYQNTVIARSYALLLPLLMLIVIYYSDRLKKPLIYMTLLILLLSSETYSFVISAVLFLFFIYDVCTAKQFNKKNISSIILYIVFVLLTAMYLKLPADYSLQLPSFAFNLKDFVLTFLNGYFDVYSGKHLLLYSVLLLVMYVSAMLLFCKDKCQVLFFVCINAINVLTISMMVGRYWHYGYVIIVFVFTLALLAEEGDYTKEKNIQKIFFNFCFVILALIQIWWGFNAVNFDIHNNYSSAKDVAEFIKKNNLDKYEISALGYEPVAIQPYFKHNIYKNYQTAYYQFSKSFEREHDIKGQQALPIIVLDPAFYNFYENFIRTLDGYKIYAFAGSIRTKTKMEPIVNLLVFVRNDIKCLQ